MRIRPHIAPDERGTDYLPARVEHDRAVHLSGETNAGDFVGAKARLLQGFRNSYAAGSPPVVGMLLGPADLGRGKRGMLLGGGCDDVPLFVDDQRARATGSNIDAENVNGASSEGIVVQTYSHS